jgi:hypothetical protein
MGPERENGRLQRRCPKVVLASERRRRAAPVRDPLRRLVSALLPLLMALMLGGASVQAALSPPADRFLCDGDPLEVVAIGGPVDATSIPNTAAGTLPGAVVVLHWRGGTLQLPRTNNAGPPSYTDGRWWWSIEDPERPTFLERRGSIRSILCRRETVPGRGAVAEDTASAPAPG